MFSILHIVYQSFPNVSGSSKRTDQIIQAQLAAGHNVELVSAPGQAPIDLERPRAVETHNQVPHHRTHLFKGVGVSNRRSFTNQTLKILALPYFAWRVYWIARAQRPDILHAHGMFYCAICAFLAGKLLSIPVVYEVRSLWYLNSGAGWGVLTQNFLRFLENWCARRAERVVVISDEMRQYYNRIGVNAVVVRNAVATRDILDLPRNVKMPLTNFGYIGSVINLEGLDMVVEAFAQLSDEGFEGTFHIVGDGEELDALKQLAKERAAPVIFHGRFPFDQVGAMYELIDCIINFRKDEPIAHEVTPLKPLEAAAHGVILVCSDVRGMVEVMGGKETAIFVRANQILSLKRTILGIASGQIDVDTPRKKATEFLRASRTWEANAIKYARLYDELVR